MKRLPLLLLALAFAATVDAQAARYRVIKVTTALNMGSQHPDSTSSNDYYVTIGQQSGLKSGTLLNVYRTRQIEDDISGATIPTEIFIGQLRPIQVQEKYCVARLATLAGSADPLRERNAVLVGDYVLPVFVIQGEKLFSKGSATLLPGAIKPLEDAATFLRDAKPSRALVEGHTDNDGSEAYNMKLSELRASAVRDYLVNQAKIDAQILVPIGCGMSRPLAPNDSPEGQATNRRFELIIQR